jgi:hypothetical protein
MMAEAICLNAEAVGFQLQMKSFITADLGAEMARKE